MNIILTVGGNKIEKQTTCVLSEEVTPKGEPKQGHFNCSLDLESAEQDIPMENLTVSRNNDQIGGCAELTTEEASP